MNRFMIVLLGFGMLAAVAGGAAAQEEFPDEPKMLYPENVQGMDVEEVFPDEPKMLYPENVIPMVRDSFQNSQQNAPADDEGTALRIYFNKETGCWVKFTAANEFLFNVRKNHIFVFVQMFKVPDGLAEANPAFMGGRKVLLTPLAGHDVTLRKYDMMTLRGQVEQTGEHEVYFPPNSGQRGPMSVRICIRTVDHLDDF